MAKYTASDGTEFDTKREWRKYEFELSFTFKNKKNEQLSKETGKIEGQPFDMAECEGCEIIITDHCDQVQIDQLKTCRVFLGASSESVFVRDCSDCTFYLACKQLRTRDCHNCTFYLYAKTEPIIELSDGICFAPFFGGYPEQAQHMKSANLDPSYNLWWGVFDFNDEFKTLNHWKYLEESERKPWFPRGGTDQICACPPPGDAAALPSQTGGNFGSSGGMMSFGFNTSLEQAEQAHLEMEATTAPPPLPPNAPATAVAPPVAVPAPAPAAAAPKKQQSFKALDRVDARFQGDATWYPGTIATALPGDKYDIAYDDGDREYAVPAALIRKATVAPVDITSLAVGEASAAPAPYRKGHREREPAVPHPLVFQYSGFIVVQVFEESWPVGKEEGHGVDSAQS